MKTTGIFTKHVVTVTLPKGVNEFRIIPFGCVHFGSSLHAEGEFLRFCESCCEGFEHTYFIGMGDYFNVASATERRALDMLHHDRSGTSEALEEYWEGLIKDFTNKTAFAWGRLWGLIEGNHYGDMSAGLTTTQAMCQEYNKHLKGTPGYRCKYLGVSNMMRVRIKWQSTRCGHLDIFSHHGKGAAATLGGSFNTVEQMARAADANIYLMGHDHRKGSLPDCKIKLVDAMDEVAIGDRPILYIRTGSFLKGYVEDRASYVVDRAYRPLQLGVVKIAVKMTRDKSGKRSFELEGTA